MQGLAGCVVVNCIFFLLVLLQDALQLEKVDKFLNKAEIGTLFLRLNPKRSYLTLHY